MLIDEKTSGKFSLFFHLSLISWPRPVLAELTLVVPSNLFHPVSPCAADTSVIPTSPTLRLSLPPQGSPEPRKTSPRDCHPHPPHPNRGRVSAPSRVQVLSAAQPASRVLVRLGPEMWMGVEVRHRIVVDEWGWIGRWWFARCGKGRWRGAGRCCPSALWLLALAASSVSTVSVEAWRGSAEWSAPFTQARRGREPTYEPLWRCVP
jgi:hypothetical protein